MLDYRQTASAHLLGEHLSLICRIAHQPASEHHRRRAQLLAHLLERANQRIDLLRKRTSQKRNGGEYALSLEELGECIGRNTTEEAVDVQALSAAIAAFLRTASPEARNVFLCRYYYLDPVKKIAGYCGISESKVKILLHRTRQELWDYLQKEGFV